MLADMHIAFLVEDISSARMLEHVLPKIIGAHAEPHTWKITPYKGNGRLPRDLNPRTDPQKRILLDQLPRLLNGYGRGKSADHVIVITDTDNRDCKAFLAELNELLRHCLLAPPTLFRLAVEETEAWYFGDRPAILKAYPKAKKSELDKYIQDSICGTWEKLADALFDGGSSKIKRQHWTVPGQLKSEWAEKIGPCMNPDINVSPSFLKLRDGLRRITR